MIRRPPRSTLSSSSASSDVYKRQVLEPLLLVIDTAFQDSVSCNGLFDGSASVAVSGGNGIYSYLWSDGQTTATASNLTAGTLSLIHI